MARDWTEKEVSSFASGALFMAAAVTLPQGFVFGDWQSSIFGIIAAIGCLYFLKESL